MLAKKLVNEKKHNLASLFTIAPAWQNFKNDTHMRILNAGVRWTWVCGSKDHFCKASKQWKKPCEGHTKRYIEIPKATHFFTEPQQDIIIGNLSIHFNPKENKAAQPASPNNSVLLATNNPQMKIASYKSTPQLSSRSVAAIVLACIAVASLAACIISCAMPNQLPALGAALIRIIRGAHAPATALAGSITTATITAASAISAISLGAYQLANQPQSN